MNNSADDTKSIDALENAKERGTDEEGEGADSLSAAQASFINALQGILEQTTKQIAALIKILLGGLYISVLVIGAFYIIVGIELLCNPENKSLEKLIEVENYFKYFMIASFSAITVIVSSCFIGAKGLLSFLLHKSSKEASGNISS